MRHRLWRHSLAGGFLGIILASAAFPASGASANSPAVSKADRVNVRSRPGYAGEIVAQLRKGQAVEVLETLTLRKPAAGEPPAWTKIVLPAETPVWASADHIDAQTHKVTADVLNVRAGPSYEFGALARVKRGTQVHPLGESKDGWMRISAPEGSVGFVPSIWLATGGPGVLAATPAKPVPATGPSGTNAPVPAVAVAAPASTSAPNPAPTNSVATPKSPAPVATAVPATTAPQVLAGGVSVAVVAPGQAQSPPPSPAPTPTGTTVTNGPAPAAAARVMATNSPALAPPSTSPSAPAVAASTAVATAPAQPSEAEPITRSPKPVAGEAVTTAKPAVTVAAAPPSSQSWFDQFVAKPAARPAAAPSVGSASTNGLTPSVASPAARSTSTTRATVNPPTVVSTVVKDETVPVATEARASRASRVKPESEPIPAGDAEPRPPRRRAAPIPPRMAAVLGSPVRPEPPVITPGTPGRRVRREGVVIRPSNIQAPSFYGLEARDSGKTINFLFTTRDEPLVWTEYRGRAVIVTGREYLDRRPFWRGIPLLDVESIEAAR